MVDFLPLENERLCIRCVAETRRSLSSPELAGAAAVLRTLFLEAELEWRAQWGRPFLDRRRLEAIVETAEVVLWWITPPNLRRPDLAALGAHATGAVMANFDRTWSLRSTTGRSLGNVFAVWCQRQAKAIRYAELEAVDRRYAAWIAAQSPGQ